VGTLLSGVQPAILAPTGTLLGRVSLGSGGPEPISVGLGVALQGSTLAATGADHAAFPVEVVLQPTDQAVISSEGTSKLLALSLLRGLFTAGTNIEIDPSGTISTTVQAGVVASGSTIENIGSLSAVTTIAANDLVGINQAGADHAITYQDFLNGLTIDEAQPASPATDSDTTWVAQGSSTMVRQTFAAIWAWLESKQPTYKYPVVELATNTNLDATVHNGRVVVCSQPLVLTPIFANMGAGFACTVLNLSTANVTLGPGIMTSTGSSTLPPGQSCIIQGVSYSGGNVVFAALSSSVATTTLMVPGAVSGVTLSNLSSSGAALSWTAPVSGGAVATYTVQYRLSGSSTWSIATASDVATSYTLSGLQASTAYDFSVFAINAAGSGAVSTVVTGSTVAAGSVAPGQVAGLSAGSSSAGSIVLTWSAPSLGSQPFTYLVAYRSTGTTAWQTFASGVTALTSTVSGLTANTAYDFEVTAFNAGGAGAPSSVVQLSTLTAGTSVSNIVWNLTPSGSYAHGNGSIGVNAHVTPAAAAIQFGFSTSATVPPTTWATAVNVNTDLWGAYVNTPATAGTWYAWAEGMDGSSPTVWATPFMVT
jgi:hypothetical protein